MLQSTSTSAIVKTSQTTRKLSVTSQSKVKPVNKTSGTHHTPKNKSKESSVSFVTIVIVLFVLFAIGFASFFGFRYFRGRDTANDSQLERNDSDESYNSVGDESAVSTDQFRGRAFSQFDPEAL